MKNRIKKLLEEKGLTRIEFSRQTGIPCATIYYLWHHPETCPQGKTFEKLLEQFTYEQIVSK